MEDREKLEGREQLMGTPNAQYGAFLNLVGRVCLVVGGGRVAQRKIGKLLQTQARVLVISPWLTKELEVWHSEGKIQWFNRNYRPGDVANVKPWLVFAATNDRAVNRQVWQEAESCGRPVNVADDADLCTFTVPASFQHEGFTVAISTSGVDPALAKRLRLTMETQIRAGRCRCFADIERT